MKKAAPEELALSLTRRSICRVKMAAVIYDSRGVFSWGWNHGSGGKGIHAEVHAISRANPKRLKGATIVVAGQHGRWNGREFVPTVPSNSLPCSNCRKLIEKHDLRIRYMKDGRWV